MKILHFGKYYPPYHGGMEHYLRDLAEQQVKQGHQVTVLVHNHRHGYLKSNTQVERQQGVDIIRQASLRPLLFTPLMLGLSKTIKRLNQQQKFDLIHIHSPNPSAFLLLFNRPAKKVAWLLRWHSDMVTKHVSLLLKMAYLFIRPFEKKLLRQSEMILTSSENYRQHSLPLKALGERVKILPLGINPKQVITENLPKNWAERQWSGNRLRLFSVGRLTFYKNHQMLLTAVEKSDCCQLIIAGNGQLKNRLQRQIKQQLKQRAKLLEQLNWQQINALYQSSDIFCLASHDRAESYGMVLLEAMIHDKIILVADTIGSGMSWLAENYNKGFTFKANDVDDFIKQINHINENLSQIKQRPKNFQLNIEKTAQQLNKHYQHILRRKS